MEKIYWLMDQTRTVHVVMAAEIGGKVPVGCWEQALAILQQRHPLLSVCIREEGPLQPAFYRVEGKGIPFRVLKDDRPGRGVGRIFCTGSTLDRELEQQLATPFDFSVAPLIRVVLIEGDHRSQIVIAIHRSIGDGMTVSFLVRDLLRAANGEDLGALPLPASQENLLGVDSAAAAASRDERGVFGDGRSIGHGEVGAVAGAGRWQRLVPEKYRILLARPKIQRLLLPEAQTTRLIRQTEKEGTTVAAALCAAFTQAGSFLFPEWKQKPVSVLLPVFAREILGIRDDICLYSWEQLLTLDNSQSIPFWDLARLIKCHIATVEQMEARREYARVLQGFADQSESVFQIDQERQACANKLMLSDLGAIPYETTFGPLRLSVVWGPVSLLGTSGQYAAGVAIINGVLSLLLSTREPLGALPGTALWLLEEACKKD